jgi:hypothetical protein
MTPASSTVLTAKSTTVAANMGSTLLMKLAAAGVSARYRVPARNVEMT